MALSSPYRLMLLIAAVVIILGMPAFIVGQASGTEAAATSGSMWKDFWIIRLSLNLLGYATIVVPGYLIIRYAQKSNYLSTAGSGWFPNILRTCINGSPDGEKDATGGTATEPPVREAAFVTKLWKLIFCSSGLLASYLLWGVLQERIMAFKYGATEDSPGVNFKNSQFLVFMNRILALLIGFIVVMVRPQPKHKAPVYKYSYSSFSNIMSSWCQYEALKFVSFPTQVLAKASKVIFVMLMGKVVSRRSYEYHEYVTALMISAGVSMFVLTSKDTVHDKTSVTTLSGLILLAGYLFFDAFTSNWQGELYKQYKMSPIQMMLGVNLFSVLFTSTTLLEQSGFVESFSFMMQYPTFMFHVIILSISSATGQLFIFHTIEVFGPVTFTIIMTIRQGLAILLSCIIYSHPVTVTGGLGILIIFAAIFMRTYLNQQKKKAARPSPPPSNANILSENTVTISMPHNDQQT